MQHKIKFEEGDDLQVRAYNESTMNVKLSCKYWNVPFVNEVEEFNETFGNQTTTTQLFQIKKNGCLFMILFKKN